jgi:large subunit ribosomal protein L4
MIDLAVYNTEGQEIDSLRVDEAAFGGSVRYPLLKQAVVMYHANKRVGTAATKGRSMVAGSGKKLFRQKGTGNARVGNVRTGKRTGGGVTFAKQVRDFGKCMPRKQRRLARDSAILAKLLGSNVVVVDEVAVVPVNQLNAGDICSHRKMLITKEALLSMLERDQATEI